MQWFDEKKNIFIDRHDPIFFFLEKIFRDQKFSWTRKKCINSISIYIYWVDPRRKKNRLNDLKTNDDTKTNLPATECITECISYAWMSICQLCDFLLTHAQKYVCFLTTGMVCISI